MEIFSIKEIFILNIIILIAETNICDRTWPIYKFLSFIFTDAQFSISRLRSLNWSHFYGFCDFLDFLHFSSVFIYKSLHLLLMVALVAFWIFIAEVRLYLQYFFLAFQLLVIIYVWFFLRAMWICQVCINALI